MKIRYYFYNSEYKKCLEASKKHLELFKEDMLLSNASCYSKLGKKEKAKKLLIKWCGMDGRPVYSREYLSILIQDNDFKKILSDNFEQRLLDELHNSLEQEKNKKKQKEIYWNRLVKYYKSKPIEPYN